MPYLYQTATKTHKTRKPRARFVISRARQLLNAKPQDKFMTFRIYLCNN